MFLSHSHGWSPRCLVYMSGSNNLRYRKVRPFSTICYMELCRHAIRYGCQLEDTCLFAHSPVELKTWALQRDSGTLRSTHALYTSGSPNICTIIPINILLQYFLQPSTLYQHKTFWGGKCTCMLFINMNVIGVTVGAQVELCSTYDCCHSLERFNKLVSKYSD